MEETAARTQPHYMRCRQVNHNHNDDFSQKKQPSAGGHGNEQHSEPKTRISPKEDKGHNQGSSGGKISALHLGFPNLGQSCYMNSCLQSLLTLEGFVRSFDLMEEIWISAPTAKLIRKFMGIREAHSSQNLWTKRRLLKSFKKEVSLLAPEFMDDNQEDAHEFLTVFLDQIRDLSPQLQREAARMGKRYRCPVKKNLVFQMENTRTCNSCGAESVNQEEFTTLSLDLVPDGSVEDMLQNHLKETELDFSCNCKATKSSQRLDFATLPKVLTLHLKRFCFTPCNAIMKVSDLVHIPPELVVTSKEGNACFSLVSVISHFGLSDIGHFISEGVHPEREDRWLTYNDNRTSETTSRSVRETTRGSAFILFYTRHEE